MARPNRIYFVDKNFNLWDTEPSGSYFSNRRPYVMEGYFRNQRENLNCTLKDLKDNSNHGLSTNQNTNGSWHVVSGKENLMKTGGGTNGMDFYWNVKTAYQQTAGFGGGFPTSSESCYWHPGVVGATFTWSRENCYWSKGECALRRWGMNYYNPQSNTWRTVVYDTHQNNTSGSSPHYKSSKGHEWRIFGGKDPTNLEGGKGGRYACSARATGVLDKIREEQWLWGGVWFQVNCTAEGGSSHTRSFKIMDFQPVYDFDRVSYSSAQLVVPRASQRTQSDARETIYLAIG